MKENLDIDAVIVGSGAAGSLMACRLAEAGKRVVILEAGPARGLGDLTSSQIWARRLKWGGAPVLESGSHTIGHGFNNGYGTGGAAMHHFGVWPRLHEDDFRMQSSFNLASDWPISYAELRPWYDKIQDEVGVSGDHEQEKWRPPGAAYNQSPVPVFAQGKLIAQGFQKRGMSTAPIPLAVLTRPVENREACIWDGWCDAGCPNGALANPLVTYLPRAIAAGARLYNDATVVAISTNAKKTRSTGVVYKDRYGKNRRVTASMVVVAASTIQNSRLLLASGDTDSGGLANSSGTLGSRVMIHLALPVYGMFAERTDCHLGATGGQLINQDGYKKQVEGKPFGSYQWLIANAMKPNDLLGIGMSRVDLHGPRLNAFMEKAARHFAMMTGVVETLPDAANRVTLSEQTDQFGMPLAAVAHTANEQSVALWQHAKNEGVDVMSAAGAEEAWAGNIGPMHIMGGTAMGTDPADSVTNSYGQCHGLSNLVVAGASLFPTSGGVNPTFTINALTARSADHLLANWNQIA